MSLLGYLFGRVVAHTVDKVSDRVMPDILAADGQPIDTTWENEPAMGLALVLHRAELELSKLREFMPRLRVCFDHGLEENQLEILQHRIGRLALQKSFHGYYNVVQRGVVTNLEIIIEHQLRGTYVIVMRGIGPAMDVVRQELDRFQENLPAASHSVAAAVVAPVEVAAAPVQTEMPPDGILRLAPDRKAWRALLPSAQGHVLGHPISVMVENKRMEHDIQPQQSDHQLLMQIFAQLPMITEQVVKYLVEHIENPESLRSVGEPMIYLPAERVDPQSWTFSVTQNHPQRAKLALEFRGVQLLR
jgi:hypothetical protein